MFGLFKPKWQHRNPEVRIEAIRSHDLHNDLIVKIAQTDKHLDVRITALKKISEPNILYALWLHESSNAGKKAVLAQISSVLAQSNNPRNTLSDFIRNTVKREFSLVDLLEASSDLQIKQLIIPLLDVKKDLPHLVAKNYQFVLDELKFIKDTDVLSFLIKTANISDKKLLAHLKACLEEETEQLRKISLKEQLLLSYQELASQENLAPLNVFSALETEWNSNELGDENLAYKHQYLHRYEEMNLYRQKQLAALQSIEEAIVHCPENVSSLIAQLQTLKEESVFSLKERAHIQSLMDVLAQQEQARKQQVAKNRTMTESVSKLRELLNSVSLGGADGKMTLEELKAQICCLAMSPERTELLNLVNQKMTSSSHIIEKFNSDAFEELSEKLEALLAEGSLQAAEKVGAELIEMTKLIHNAKDQHYYQRRTKQLLQPLQDQLDTARWSIYQTIELLCEKAESLSNEDSLDLVSVQLKQLRDDWQLAKKGLSHVPHRLHRKFEEACHNAYQRISKEREDNNKARQVYLDEAEELLSQLNLFVNNVDWESPNWDLLLETKQRFLKEWNRYLNQYATDGALTYGEPLFLNRDKYRLEKKMRQILKPLDHAIHAERVNEKARREAEIASLHELLQANQLKEAVDAVKIINKSFAPTVKSNRQDENLLWKQLRKINDEIFAKRGELVSAQDDEKLVNATQKRQLLDELRVILSNVSQEKGLMSDEVFRQKLLDIKQQWSSIGYVPKNDYQKLEQEFKQIFEQIDIALGGLEQERQSSVRLELLNDSYKIGCWEATLLMNDLIELTLEELSHSNAGLRKRLRRIEQVLNGHEGAQNQLKRMSDDALRYARDLVVVREILLDKVTPEDDKELRLTKQVELLEESLTNHGCMVDKRQRLADLDDLWLENVVGNIPQILYERFR